MTIDEFIIKIGLDPTELKKGIAQVQQAVNSMANNAKKKLSDMSNSIKTGMANVVSNMATKANEGMANFVENLKPTLEKFAKAGAILWTTIFTSFTLIASEAFAKFISDANRISKSAEDIGVSVETLSTLENAANSAGGSVSELEKDMKALAKEAGGDAYGALKELAALADEMGAEEYTTYAEALGLSRTTIDLTKDGTQAFKDQMRNAKELGIITKDDAKLARDFSRGMNDLWQSLRGVANIVIRMVLPAFNQALSWLRQAVVFLRQHETLVKAFFVGLAAVIMTQAIPAILALSAAMLASPITWMLALVAALALAFEDLVVWAEGGESAFADIWESVFGDPEHAKQIWEDLKKTVEDVWTSIKTFVLEAWDAITEGFNNTVARIAKALEDLKANFAEFASWVKPIFDFIGGGISGAQSAVNSAIDRGSQITGDTTSMNTDGRMDSNGGIFTSPTKTLVGEAGAEAIIPFSPGKKNRGLELLSKIAGNFMDSANNAMPVFNIPAAQALPMGGASTVNNNNVDTRVTVGTVNISAENGTDAANQFMSGIETRAQSWTAAANVAY